MGLGRTARRCLVAAALVIAGGCGAGDDGDAEVEQTGEEASSSTIDLLDDDTESEADGGSTGTQGSDDAEVDGGEGPGAESSGAESSGASSGDRGPDPGLPVLVAAGSFGEAALCVTGDELQAIVPDLVVGPYEDQGALVDTEGVTVTDADGNVEFHALALSGEGPQLSIFYTDNPRYQTAEGVGPGTELAIAASIYGPATLSYNVEAESREYASFIAGPNDIGFRTGSGPEAGIYEAEEGFNETDNYEPSATIQAVEIISPGC